MSLPSPLAFPISLALALAAALLATPARAVPRETCMGAAEASQELRKRDKLSAAREQLRTCADKSCPAFVRRDCATWLGEVDDAMPSVTLRARDTSGKAVTDVRVLVDGTVVASALRSAPAETRIDLDPGPHLVRFEGPNGAVRESKVSLKERDKGVLVAVTFDAPKEVPPPPPPPVRRPDAVPTGTFVFAGVSVLALGGFAYFGASGVSAYEELERTCKPRCSSDQTNDVDRKFLVANLALGVAVVSAAAAAVFYLTRPTTNAARRPLVATDRWLGSDPAAR